MSVKNANRAGRRLVLFGESGFIGSNLLRHIQAAFYAPSAHEADLTRPDTLRRVLRSGDIVVNAAGYANATDRTPKGRKKFYAINVEGVRNLGAACIDVGARQLVHISSVAAMGRCRGEKLGEDALGPMTSPYAESKRDGERALKVMSGKLAVTILRPTSVFGEGRGLGAALCSVVRKGIVPLPAGGTAKIPFSYVGNLAHAVSLVAGTEQCFDRTFIVGDSESYGLREIVDSIAHAMGRKVCVLPFPTAAFHIVAAVLEQLAGLSGRSPLLDRGRVETMATTVSYSTQALKQATGYVPPYDLHEACRRMVAWYERSERSR